MSTHQAIINGNFVAADEARITISDLSIQRGYGIFDFFKVLNGRPIFLDDHLERFYRSASLLRLPVQQTREELKALLRELLRRNNQPNCGVRITLTGGHSDDGYSIGQPNLLVTQRPLPNNKALSERGIRLMTHEHQRQIPEAKSIDYLMPIWLQPILREKNADDVLYHRGRLLSECPRSNIFVVTPKDEVLTPARNVLKGVIREKILQLAQSNIRASERDVTLDDLRAAKEVFMTSTTKNILPVVSIDGAPVGSGKPGSVGSQLSELLSKRIQADLEPSGSGT
jgi:D-alanine transaminase/branched-chain amino acid aminotransferase